MLGLYPTFHIGDCPHGQEPGTGEINFTRISQKLDELGFDGLIGMECYPSTTEEEALARIREYFPRAKVDEETRKQVGKWRWALFPCLPVYLSTQEIS